jgi:hypothetical protein
MSNKKNIHQIFKKRMQTVMIGAIAKFEDNFGFLWGQENENLTAEQTRNKILWDKTRTEILDHGNNQIRLAITESKQGEHVDRVKYSYYYKINNPRRPNQ